MASSVTCGEPLYLDGFTYNGAQARTAHIAASFMNTGISLPASSGVLPSGGAMSVNAGAGMSVVVGTGYCVVAATSGFAFGAYLVPLTAVATLSLATADAVNSRIDVVCVTVTDVGSSGSSAVVQVLTGVPAPNPVAPNMPLNSLQLAQVTVTQNATSVTGNVSDQRAWTVAQGGIVPMLNLSDAPAGYSGLYGHDRNTQRLVHCSSSGVVQPVVLPFTPQINFNGNDVHATSSEQALCSVTVTVDGSTDIEIIARYPGISVANGSGGALAHMNLYIGGTQVARVDTANQPNADGVCRGGGTIHHVTSGAGGDTPAQGTRTIAFRFYPVYDGTHQVTVNGTVSPSMLYVRPVPL